MAPVTLSQEGRWLRLSTPLGADIVAVEEMEGREQLSQPFRFQIRGLCSQTFAPADLLGAEVGLTLARFAAETREIRGIVTNIRFIQQLRSGYRRCELDIEPTITILQHSSNYRIFQEKSVVDIATAIFSDRSITNFRFDVVGEKTPRPYCVQFNETDLAFVSRLFEEEGYFYFFEHDATAHTLVVSDSDTKYAAAGDPLAHHEGSVEGERLVRTIALNQRMADMKWTMQHFDFKAPASAITGTSQSTLSTTGAWSGWEQFAFAEGEPVGAEQGTAAGRRVDAADKLTEELAGESTATSLVPGHKFTVTSTAYADVQLLSGSALADETFVVTALEHHLVDPSYFNSRIKAEGKPTYFNRFRAIPASRIARPAFHTAKPLAFGPQTAIVVGAAGSEIYTDAHGRVRVQFHWDRLGTKDDQSSCFIRVAQAWAGKGWGAQFIPRVGMEVVVHFLQGDPDQPLITGTLYNGENTPPYSLPANMTQSGIKTRSSKSGTTEDFNELRFEDKKGSEDVYFHAQKDFHRVVENDDDLKVQHDQTRTVTNDRTTTISEGNESFTISKGNRTETISKGNETLDISEGNRTVTLAKGNDALTLSKGNLGFTLDAGNFTTALTKGNLSIDLTGGNLSQKCAAGTVTIEAAQGITLKCGSSTIEVTPQGVTIKGLQIAAQATAKAELSGAMTDVKGSGMVKLEGGLVKIN